MLVEKGSKKLYYSTQGEGDPALIFVHGWMASSAVWREQVLGFAPQRQVVTFDLTGYGASAKPPDQGYALEVWLEDLDLMLDHLHLQRPILIGWSMGGAIGIAYAATRPQALSKLVLVGTTPLLVAQPEVFEHAAPPEAGAQLAAALQNDFSTAARGFVEAMLPEPDTAALKDELHAITQQTTSHVALESVRTLGGTDLRPLLQKIGIPTLVLHGADDLVCKPGAGRCIADTVPGAQWHLFAEKGHVPFLTGPAAFNARLLDFI